MSATVSGPDGLPRCGWRAATPDYTVYHDTEWSEEFRSFCWA